MRKHNTETKERRVSPQENEVRPLSPQVQNYGSYLFRSLTTSQPPPYDHRQRRTPSGLRRLQALATAAAAKMIPSAPLTQISATVVHPHRPADDPPLSGLSDQSQTKSKPFRQSHPANPYSCTSCSSYPCSSLTWVQLTVYRFCMLLINLRPRVPSLSVSSQSTADGEIEERSD